MAKKPSSLNHPPRRQRMAKPAKSAVTIFAEDVYDAYPHVDLLPIRRPLPGWTLSYWLECRKRELNACGDTLFLFVLRELSDARGEVYEGMDMLQRAIFDLEAVRDAIGDLNHA